MRRNRLPPRSSCRSSLVTRRWPLAGAALLCRLAGLSPVGAIGAENEEGTGRGGG